MGSLLGVLSASAIILLMSALRIDREYKRGVIFRLGRYHSTKGPGVYLVLPLVDQKAEIDIRTKTVDIPPQETVTADSVTIKVNAVLFYRIIDPSKAVNKVENYNVAVSQSAMTTLRNVGVLH